jgi:hypothetical protein
MHKYKFLIASLFLLFFTQEAYAMEDTLIMHNGSKVIGEVVNVNHFMVTFKYKNEKSEHEISHYAIEKIHFGSGRVQTLTDKVTINGEEDWEKVIILEDKEQSAGLKRKGEISARTRFLNLHTAYSGNIKVAENLKREAAKQKYPFILISFERATVYNGLIKSWGAIQEIKRAFCYQY